MSLADLPVVVVKEDAAVRRLAVTASTADLLHVVLGRFGHVVVDHHAHVGFVETHSKGDRGANNLWQHAHIPAARYEQEQEVGVGRSIS